MKSKSFMLMILSMGFGLIAAIGISQVMGRNNSPTVAAPKMGPVLVAMEHLDHNAFLSEENVRVENWPVEIIPETAATTIEQIKDMATRAQLSKGLPIMMPHLVHKNDVQDLHIPKGFKVVAIKVSEDDTIAGLLNPGDKVDVIGHFRSKDRSGFFSKTFLKALRVFSVNSQMTAQAGSRTETSTRGSAIVGVLVTERQAEAIVHVQKTGSLKLVLRGDYFIEGDDDDVDKLLGAIGEDNSKDSEPAPQTEKKSIFPTFGLRPAVSQSSMIVWNGNEPQKTVFRGGTLPESSYHQPSRREQANQVKNTTSEDSNSFDESDRGLEEDQYQGE